jgi:hypothetical protein
MNKPSAAMEDALMRSLAKIIRDYITAAVARDSVYQETGAVQFTVKAAHHAWEWHPELQEGAHVFTADGADSTQ